MIAEIIVWAVLAYVVLDFFLAVRLGRCVLPGLKCGACKRESNHG